MDQLADVAGTALFIALHAIGVVTTTSNVAGFSVPQPGASDGATCARGPLSALAQADQLEGEGIHPRSDEGVLGPALLEADDHIVEGPLIQPRLE
ncbi:hypothetical protein SAMN06296378_2095 [Salinibacterium xinjiangense]|uniref:Uncharacterized protein n=1 Tax=Salinibacterium xinjiangense TaxID=386302 RepID=A0A2C8ZVW6_9MICO|nr:hypothetical protein SAMN06296378_2095 [Salinibacterium xinjiangense]